MTQPDETPFYRAVDAASLGRAISEARKESGMTQQELAARLAVGRGTVVRLEGGKAVSVAVAMKAIRLIGRDVALIPRFSRLQVMRQHDAPPGARLLDGRAARRSAGPADN